MFANSQKTIIHLVLLFILYIPVKILILAGEQTKALPSLKVVHIIYRHGHRTPLSTYPNDPNPVKSYENGFQHLSNFGKQQMYNNGKYLKNRYSNFLSSKYVPEEIYVRSSESDRTISSALCTLAGMYPPSDDQLWNPDIKWQPIPVYSVPKDYDKILTSNKCSRHRKYLEQLPQLKELQDALKPKQEFIHFLLQQSGINTYDIKLLSRLIDAIQYQNFLKNKMKQPSWVNATVLKIADEISDIIFTFKRFYGENKVLLGGPLISHIINQMKKWTVNQKSFEGRKLWMYSTHDGIIGPVLAILDNFHNQKIPVGTTLMLELHEVNQTYFVHMLLRNFSSEDPLNIKLSNCHQLCPLENFTAIVSEVLSSVATDCKGDPIVYLQKAKDNKEENTFYYYLNVVFLFLAIIFITYYYFYKCK